MSRRFRIRSFRVRIMALTVLLSGAVLVAFACFGWMLIRRLSVERVDGVIRDAGHRELSRLRTQDAHWPHVERVLNFAFNPRGPGVAPAAIMVWNAQGEVAHQSPNWPAGLKAAALPVPVEQEQLPEPGGPPERGGQPAGPRPGPGPPRGTPGDGWDEAGFGPWDDGRPPPPRGMRGPPPGRGPEGGPAGPPPPLRAGFATLRREDAHWRVGVLASGGTQLAVAVNLDIVARDLQRVARAILVGLPASLALIALGGWVLAGRALRPVTALTAAAEQISARKLQQRVAESGESAELDRLIRVFNDMLDRLARSFQQATRFSADAAHELKTPLTILQGHVAQTLQEAPEDSALQRTCGLLLEEVQRLSGIVRKLLLLSLADAGQLRVDAQAVDLGAIVADLAEDVRILAPDRLVEVRVQDGAAVHGDPDLLGQVLRNLTTNAIRYGTSGGQIGLDVDAEGDRVRVRVTNTGPAIPAEDRARVFDRFYRADKSRTRAGDALGLGLSLAREIAHAHGGELVLERSDGQTTVFALTLPRAG